ncbi:hypothetical protein ACUV84_031335 [Puccinellia chinampoensis]
MRLGVGDRSSFDRQGGSVHKKYSGRVGHDRKEDRGGSGQAGGCSLGEKDADAGFVSVVEEEEKPRTDAAGDEKIFVMSHERVDYILSWDMEEDKFHRFDHGSDVGNKAYDIFRKVQLERCSTSERYVSCTDMWLH